MFAILDLCLQSSRGIGDKHDDHEYKDEDVVSLFEGSVKKAESVKTGSIKGSDDHSSYTPSSQATTGSMSDYSSGNNNNNVAGHNSNVAGHNSNVAVAAAAAARNKNTNAGPGSTARSNAEEHRGSLNVVDQASVGYSGAASMTVSDNLLADMVDVLMDILEEMRLMRKGTSNERLVDTNQELVTTEWQDVSTVIDRACFVVYSVINIIFATVIANRRPVQLNLADIVLPSEV